MTSTWTASAASTSRTAASRLAKSAARMLGWIRMCTSSDYRAPLTQQLNEHVITPMAIGPQLHGRATRRTVYRVLNNPIQHFRRVDRLGVVPGTQHRRDGLMCFGKNW